MGLVCQGFHQKKMKKAGMVLVFWSLMCCVDAAGPVARSQVFMGTKPEHKELLPVGEGAYQSAEAVRQRTRDSRTNCEDGDWNNCFGKDKSDLLDGHSYGHLVPKPVKKEPGTTA